MNTLKTTVPRHQDAERLGFRDHALTARESFCIVPPFRTDNRKLASPPKLTYRGGHLLCNVEVITTFWGDAWQQQPQSDLGRGIGVFFNDILQSELIEQLNEYNVAGQTIGTGQIINATLVLGTLGNQLSDAQLQAMLHNLISGNANFPQPSPNRLYFMYLPSGVEVVSGSDRSCQQFCGYHSATQDGIYYAVMPYPCDGSCTGGLSTLDALTAVSSHELCEAITDPFPGQGWYDDANGEIGDICAWQQKSVRNHTVQMEWSNRANRCV